MVVAVVVAAAAFVFVVAVVIFLAVVVVDVATVLNGGKGRGEETGGQGGAKGEGGAGRETVYDEEWEEEGKFAGEKEDEEKEGQEAPNSSFRQLVLRLVGMMKAMSWVQQTAEGQRQRWP